jgi:ubiquinone/menaquinone biosynthesis C-methylase UbiE
MEYENYSATSHVYDVTRQPVGVTTILRALATSPHALLTQTILDGGCGTGNYLAAMYSQIGTLHGLDLNHGMLTQARQKLAGVASVHLLHGSLECLPYRTASFDGMMCNQVVHHLSFVAGTMPFVGLRRLLGEAARVLRAEGLLVFNTSSHRQVQDGFWWADLIPEAVSRVRQRLPTLADFYKLLHEAGFVDTTCEVLHAEVLQGPQYLDPMGPFSSTYRQGDSTWSLATSAELQRALARLQALHETGEIMSYLQQREYLRQQVGQTTCVLARKTTARP